MKVKSPTGFDGHVALVTGAGSGIGEAIARRLGAFGAHLALAGRRSTVLDALAKSMSPGTANVRTYPCDVSEKAQLERLAQTVEQDFGGVDILVHSAGVFAMGSLEEVPADEFERQFRVNLLAPYSLTRRFAPSLRARRGQVVFINSRVVRGCARALPSQYAATKAGLKTVADSLREELNPEGVRVLSVFVGRTATPMQKAIFEQEGREYKPKRLLQPTAVAAVVVSCLSLPKTAEVTEIDIRPMNRI